MLSHRIIPMLLCRNRALLKTTNFQNPKYVGDPLNAIRIFNEKEVDELVLLDIGATPDGSGPSFDLVEEVASECFMPLAYGGGIDDVAQARRLFSLGVEKVVVKHAAYRDPSLLTRIAEVGGSQSVAVAIDVRSGRFSRPRIFAPGSPLDGSPDWEGLMHRAISAGAGEIILTAVHREGTGLGLDHDLVSKAAQTCSVPLVAAGGVGSLAHIKEGVDAGADAVGAGSFFVFRGSRKAVLITYPDYDELQRLIGGQ